MTCAQYSLTDMPLASSLSSRHGSPVLGLLEYFLSYLTFVGMTASVGDAR